MCLFRSLSRQTRTRMAVFRATLPDLPDDVIEPYILMPLDHEAIHARKHSLRQLSTH